jgi:foldase protein PrsA
MATLTRLHLRRIVVLATAAAMLAVATACGSDSGDVPQNSVAVVGKQSVTKAELEQILDQTRTNSRQSRRPFPKPGTPQYLQIREQLIQFLVRRAQFAAEADKRGIEISEEQVDERRKGLIQQFFAGKPELYEKNLEKNGVNDEQTRDDIRASLIQEALLRDVNEGIEVSEAEVRKHYGKNKERFAEPDRRDIRQIVFRKEQGELARSVAAQLRAGANFAQLARRYSQDPASKQNGGRLEISKGQIASLDVVAFSIATHKISDPVRTPLGWNVIEASGPVRVGTTPPYKQVKDEVRADLLQRKRNAASSKYVLKLVRNHAVKYQNGFAPRQ